MYWYHHGDQVHKHVAYMRKTRNSHKLLVGKHYGETRFKRRR